MAEKARDEAIDRTVTWTFDKVIVPILSSIVPAILLTIVSGARSFWGWLVLTWPLTVATAAVVVLLARPLKTSNWMAQVTIAAGVLWGATFLGASASGSPIEFTPGASGPGPLRLLFGLLTGFAAAYGVGPFVLSLLAGTLIGWLCLTLVPEEA